MFGAIVFVVASLAGGVEQDQSVLHFDDSAECIERAQDCLNAALSSLYGGNMGAGSTAEPIQLDLEYANRLLEFLCDDDVISACTELGFQISIGRGVPQQLQRGIEMLERNCEGADYLACMYLGAIFQGDTELVPADFERSAAAYARGCQNQVSAACFGLADSYNLGRGVESDRAEAARFYELACSASFPGACWNAGDILWNDNDLFDPEGSAAVFLRGCLWGDQPSCGRYGYQQLHGIGVDQNIAEARQSLNDACANMDGAACANLGEALISGISVETDQRQGMAFMARACELEVVEACDRLDELRD